MGKDWPVLKLKDMEEKHLHNLFLKNMSGLIEEVKNPTPRLNPNSKCGGMATHAGLAIELGITRKKSLSPQMEAILIWCQCRTREYDNVNRNAMQMGEFEVIKELLAAFPEAKVAKAQVDKLIDLAAPPPRGTGVENIRECIIESKMTFDVSSDDWQAYLKAKIMNNIERYFYLIVFAMYIRELGPKGFPQTFKQFMDDHSGLRTMIEEGRGKLEWERKIPDEKLSELKDMLSSADSKANMPKVIKRIYELSWDMFGDLPRGHHKNNSMHKLASKTMIEILPENLANHVEKKCGSLAGTPDFFDVIGQVSWYEPEA